MVATLVQYKLCNAGGAGGTFVTTPTPGNLLIYAVGNRDELSLGPLSDPPPTGWTRVPLVGGAGAYIHARDPGAAETLARQLEPVITRAQQSRGMFGAARAF